MKDNYLEDTQCIGSQPVVGAPLVSAPLVVLRGVSLYFNIMEVLGETEIC